MNFPWCVVDGDGVVVANFDKESAALMCCTFFINVHVEYRN